MVFSRRSKLEEKQQDVNVQEVFNLWDVLTADYVAIERIQIWQNYVDDIDLKYFINDFMEDLRSAVKSLEKKLESYGVRIGEKPPKAIHTARDAEIIRDEKIAHWAFLLLQEKIELRLRASRTSVTNDLIRETFIDMAKKRIGKLDLLIKYLKTKGWISSPPMYPNIPKNTDESLDVAEAFHLWDHLNYRYNNFQQSQLYSKLAHDGDLQVLINLGLKTLNKQINNLEKELNRFGIPMPKRPPEYVPVLENTELITDVYIYEGILRGIQGSMIVHSEALRQSVTNDRIRNLFKQLLYQEVGMETQWIKYGKIKGWLSYIPKYRL